MHITPRSDHTTQGTRIFIFRNSYILETKTNITIMGGQEEAFCASVLCDKNDPTRLTSKEIRASWGTLENFVVSYGLKPWDLEDLKEALAISRALKENDRKN